MKKFYIIVGIIAGVLLIAGGALVGIGIASGADKAFKLFGKIDINIGEPQLVVQDYKELDEFDSIDVDVNLANVEITASGDDKYGIEYKVYSNNVKCEFKGNKLVFKEKGTFGFDFGFFGNIKQDTYVKIYVPEKELQSITLSADMGSVTVSDVVCDYLSAECNMGSMTFNNITANDVELDADMGSVELTGTVTGMIEADLDMGSAELTGYFDCDMDIDCGMGDIDIITYYDASSYDWYIDCDMGQYNINESGGEKTNSHNIIRADCDMGSAEITFKDAP